MPDRAAELHLHDRLLAKDGTASSDLAATYLSALIRRVTERNDRSIDPALVEEAAGTAILSLIYNPASYDLLNLLQKEQKHRTGRKSWQDVEQSPLAGKYLVSKGGPESELEANEERRNRTTALAFQPMDANHVAETWTH